MFHHEQAGSMSGTKQKVNPFRRLPKDLSQIIKNDFVGAELSDKMSFGQCLKLLHEEDDVTPEEVLDIIVVRKSKDGEVFHTSEKLLEYPRKNADGWIDGGGAGPMLLLYESAGPGRRIFGHLRAPAAGQP